MEWFHYSCTRSRPSKVCPFRCRHSKSLHNAQWAQASAINGLYICTRLSRPSYTNQMLSLTIIDTTYNKSMKHNLINMCTKLSRVPCQQASHLMTCNIKHIRPCTFASPQLCGLVATLIAYNHG